MRILWKPLHFGALKTCTCGRDKGKNSLYVSLLGLIECRGVIEEPAGHLKEKPSNPEKVYTSPSLERIRLG
jgi:hypothetical protein